MKYKITYERRTQAKLSFYNYATEILEVRGSVHAHKLARDHLKELRKLTPYELRIDTLYRVEKKANDD